MAKILVDGLWYDQLAPNSLYEKDFENLLQLWAEEIFPHYYLIPFKKTVYSDVDSARADFALIERQYREWWVVEVEMAHHSFNNHVWPQVEVLSDAIYGLPEARYLYQQSGEHLNIDRLEAMMKGLYPRILVVVNSPQPSWIEPLRQLNAMVTVVEVFRSRRNKHICRVNGEAPEPDLSKLSECELHPLLDTFLVIEQPGSLGVGTGGKLIIKYRDQITEWRRNDIKDTVYLIFEGKQNPLSRKKKYVLFRGEGDDLEIKPKL